MDAGTQILQAADELFGDIGFDATTTREIAERAGVNKALIHYHFSSKDGLLERLLDRYYDQLAETLSTSLEGSDADLRSRFGDLIDAYLAFLSENRNFSRIVQREAAGGRHMAQIQNRMLPMFAMAIAAFDERFPDSAGSSLAAPHLLNSFYGMITSTFTYSGVLEHLLEADPLSQEQLEQRRSHLHRMLDITFEALEHDEAGGAR
jgi:AcrR family transcriptional regulator